MPKLQLFAYCGQCRSWWVMNLPRRLSQLARAAREMKCLGCNAQACMIELSIGGPMELQGQDPVSGD